YTARHTFQCPHGEPMKKMRAQYIIIGTFVALLLSGCAKPGAEYVGKWVNKKSPKDQFEIIRNGDNFLVRKTRQGIFGKETDHHDSGYFEGRNSAITSWASHCDFDL